MQQTHNHHTLPCLFFFFSSRRRHTRFDCDWSSDVCSSDLSAAQGVWLIFLDDDDTLVPGALTVIYNAAEHAGGGFHRHTFAYRDDDGRISPRPALTDGEVWDYRGYLEWVDQVSEQTDFMNCIHRDVFDYVR